jgi:hypothetical protein
MRRFDKGEAKPILKGQTHLLVRDKDYGPKGSVKKNLVVSKEMNV